jgi:sugar phosphate isomerase/epimerase
VCQWPIEYDYAEWVGPQVWGDGDHETMYKRAQRRLIQTARAAKKLGVVYVKTFFGSRIYRRLMTDFPPTPQQWVEDQWEIMVPRMLKVLDAFGELGVFLALEAHKGESAWNVETMIELHRRLNNHPYFTYNWDGSHPGGQGVNVPDAIRALPPGLIHVCHWKGVSFFPGGTRSILSPYPMGHSGRGWNYVNIADDPHDHREHVKALNEYGLPPDSELSIEHEDNAMANLAGAIMAYRATREHHAFTAPAGSYEEQMK